MATFNREDAQRFQDDVLSRVRDMERMLDTEVNTYYRNDPVDDENDYYENLRGLDNYLRDAYKRLDRILTDIENRLKN
jgi:uncharacterized protein YbaP (TraB family)